MRCWITGGCGFIGSHLAMRLAELGHGVVVLDLPNAVRQAGRGPEWQEFGRVSFRYVGSGSITLHGRDITKPIWDIIHHRLELPQADWIFHLAARADVIPSIENPLAYHKANVDGTLNVLELARRSGCQKFIYASSTSIYGIPERFPTPETAKANPQYPYALTKWVAEECVMHWGRVYHLPVISLRISQAYGPGMKSRGAYGSVFKVFMAQKANGAPYTVVGDGSQARDFVFISDVVEAFIKAAESPVTYSVLNVGSGEPTTINRLIELLGKENGVVHIPWRPGEPLKTTADIWRIKTILGWEPQVSIEKGVKIMLEHLDDWKNEEVWTKESIEQATRSWYQYLSPT